MRVRVPRSTRAIACTCVIACALPIVLAPSSAAALSCEPYTIESRFASSTAVFLGHVMAKVVEDEEQIVTFRVDFGWKGAPAHTELVVRAPVSKWGWTFAPGGDFVVFADRERGALRTGLCAGTIDAKQAPRATDELVAKLHTLSRRAPTPSAHASGVASASSVTPPAPFASASPPAPSASPPAPSASPSASASASAAPPPAIAPSSSGCAGCALAPAYDRTAGPAFAPFAVVLAGLRARRRRR